MVEILLCFGSELDCFDLKMMENLSFLPGCSWAAIRNSCAERSTVNAKDEVENNNIIQILFIYLSKVFVCCFPFSKYFTYYINSTLGWEEK